MTYLKCVLSPQRTGQCCSTSHSSAIQNPSINLSFWFYWDRLVHSSRHFDITKEDIRCISHSRWKCGTRETYEFPVLTSIKYFFCDAGSFQTSYSVPTSLPFTRTFLAAGFSTSATPSDVRFRDPLTPSSPFNKKGIAPLTEMTLSNAGTQLLLIPERRGRPAGGKSSWVS